MLTGLDASEGDTIIQVHAQIMDWDEICGGCFGWVPLDGGGISVITLVKCINRDPTPCSTLVISRNSNGGSITPPPLPVPSSVCGSGSPATMGALTASSEGVATATTMDGTRTPPFAIPVSAASMDPVLRYDYLILGVRIDDRKELLRCPVCKDGNYRSNVMSTCFHVLEMGHKKFGLSFQSTLDANQFHQKVQKAVEHLYAQSKSSSGESNADSEELEDDVFVPVEFPQHLGHPPASSSGYGPQSSYLQDLTNYGSLGVEGQSYSSVRGLLHPPSTLCSGWHASDGGGCQFDTDGRPLKELGDERPIRGNGGNFSCGSPDRSFVQKPSLTHQKTSPLITQPPYYPQYQPLLHRKSLTTTTAHGICGKGADGGDPLGPTGRSRSIKGGSGFPSSSSFYRLNRRLHSGLAKSIPSLYRAATTDLFSPLQSPDSSTWSMISRKKNRKKSSQVRHVAPEAHAKSFDQPDSVQQWDQLLLKSNRTLLHPNQVLTTLHKSASVALPYPSLHAASEAGRYSAANPNPYVDLPLRNGTDMNNSGNRTRDCESRTYVAQTSSPLHHRSVQHQQFANPAYATSSGSLTSADSASLIYTGSEDKSATTAANAKFQLTNFGSVKSVTSSSRSTLIGCLSCAGITQTLTQVNPSSTVMAASLSNYPHAVSRSRGRAKCLLSKSSFSDHPHLAVSTASFLVDHRSSPDRASLASLRTTSRSVEHNAALLKTVAMSDRLTKSANEYDSSSRRILDHPVGNKVTYPSAAAVSGGSRGQYFSKSVIRQLSADEKHSKQPSSNGEKLLLIGGYDDDDDNGSRGDSTDNRVPLPENFGVTAGGSSICQKHDEINVSLTVESQPRFIDPANSSKKDVTDVCMMDRGNANSAAASVHASVEPMCRMSNRTVHCDEFSKQETYFDSLMTQSCRQEMIELSSMTDRLGYFINRSNRKTADGGGDLNEAFDATDIAGVDAVDRDCQRVDSLRSEAIPGVGKSVISLKASDDHRRSCPDHDVLRSFSGTKHQLSPPPGHFCLEKSYSLGDTPRSASTGVTNEAEAHQLSATARHQRLGEEHLSAAKRDCNSSTTTTSPPHQLSHLLEIADTGPAGSTRPTFTTTYCSVLASTSFNAATRSSPFPVVASNGGRTTIIPPATSAKILSAPLFSNTGAKPLYMLNALKNNNFSDPLVATTASQLAPVAPRGESQVECSFSINGESLNSHSQMAHSKLQSAYPLPPGGKLPLHKPVCSSASYPYVYFQRDPIVSPPLLAGMEFVASSENGSMPYSASSEIASIVGFQNYYRNANTSDRIDSPRRDGGLDEQSFKRDNMGVHSHLSGHSPQRFKKPSLFLPPSAGFKGGRESSSASAGPTRPNPLKLTSNVALSPLRGEPYNISSNDDYYYYDYPVISGTSALDDNCESPVPLSSGLREQLRGNGFQTPFSGNSSQPPFVSRRSESGYPSRTPFSTTYHRTMSPLSHFRSGELPPALSSQQSFSHYYHHLNHSSSAVYPASSASSSIISTQRTTGGGGGRTTPSQSQHIGPVGKAGVGRFSSSNPQKAIGGFLEEGGSSFLSSGAYSSNSFGTSSLGGGRNSTLYRYQHQQPPSYYHHTDNLYQSSRISVKLPQLPPVPLPLRKSSSLSGGGAMITSGIFSGGGSSSIGGDSVSISKFHGTSSDIVERAQCLYCRARYRVGDNERGSCPEAPDPCDRWIRRVSCLWCASCMVYCCLKDEEGADLVVPGPGGRLSTVREEPCTCVPESGRRCKRWSLLALLSLVVPCLWCYPVLRLCHSCCRACSVCGGRHKPIP